MTPRDLLSAFDHPAALAGRATARRNEFFGTAVRVLADAPRRPPSTAARLRDASFESLDGWPARSDLRDGDHIVVQIDPTADARERFVHWLREIAASPRRWSLAPCSLEPAGVHRLWCFAAARLCLPETVRIEVRHDLVGLRLGQLALGFGADTLRGPIEPDRKLPLAGLPRPTEATLAGLRTLVTQTGLEPNEHADA